MSTQQAEAILKEAERLYGLGLAIHWLRQNSKVPTKGGWSGSVRDDWKTLQREYRRGYGLGIRLGEASKIGGGCLGALDLDIRSTDPRYHKEAIAVIDRFYPGLRETAPFVLTGRGFGSSHFYFVTDSVVQSRNLGRSSEMVKVYSPTSDISGGQREFVTTGKLSMADLERGFRMKAAWEVDLMSAGKQVVAPPTRHPDTSECYRWGRGLE